MIRALTPTGCRREEIINLDWREVDAANSCLRLRDSKEEVSVRPIGLPVVELIEARQGDAIAGAMFEGTVEGKPFIGFPKHWRKILTDTPLADITPHVLRIALPALRTISNLQSRPLRLSLAMRKEPSPAATFTRSARR
jgi:integrase